MTAGYDQFKISRGRLLSELARSTSGNTLAIFAAFLFPLAIMTGAAVDTARVYVVKTRLQQACDAGALAGRKTMTATSGSVLDTTALTQANSFFSNNFRAGWVGTTGVAFTPVRAADGQVNATSTATVPMTLMRMFGNNSVPITVTCSARLDIGDSDVMFVLDVTGSMGCTAANGNTCGGRTSYTRADGTTGHHRTEQTGSKMQGLRNAVLLFYDTIAANKPAAANIRYGFVPYSNSVNIGDTIPGSYYVDQHNYESRKLDPGPTTVTGGIESDVTNGASSDLYYTTATSAACDAYVVHIPVVRSAGNLSSYNTDGRATVRTKVSWAAGTNGCRIRSQPVRVSWRYERVSLNVANYKTGASTPDPTKVTGATSVWQGCVEERDTTTATSFNINSLPGDLDPDLMPTNDATRWRPQWPDVTYFRGNNTSIDDSGGSTTVYGDTTTTTAGGTYTNLLLDANDQDNEYDGCMKRAKRLSVMTRAQVSNYVNHVDFKAHGWTFHDVGMIWGTRFISPSGPFADDTAAWAGNSPPNRYIVFMSDGALNTSPSANAMYGMERYAARVTGATGATNANQNTRHNSRFLAVCEAAKARNITVFVVAFGTAMTTEMQSCATPGFAYTAGNNTALATAFGQIALKVAKLRLTQ